ncbi:hypothetical protein CK203_087966 [Vitis vinifera]|uniref:Uncharacterized protein n=1 Tax=Vitis vinifera TaxID=29760 RepID=A0A438D7V5_VITVI|nr:hypothetical protein CK203_087966 [Vitis vinifera]
MVTFTTRSSCNNPLALFILNTHLTSAIFTKPFVGLNKLQELGSTNSVPLLPLGDLNLLAHTPLYSSNMQHLMFSSFLSTLMTSSSLVVVPLRLPFFISQLSSTFALRDLGSLYYFFGIGVTHSTDSLHLCQQKYVHDLLTRTAITNAILVLTLGSLAKPLSLTDGDLLHIATLLAHYSVTTPKSHVLPLWWLIGNQHCFSRTYGRLTRGRIFWRADFCYEGAYESVMGERMREDILQAL